MVIISNAIPLYKKIPNKSIAFIPLPALSIPDKSMSGVFQSF
jgi:hypothetical protein